MARMTDITVLGQGRAQAAAERASVAIRTTSEAKEPAAAMYAAAAAHARVCDEARSHVATGAAERWHADRVAINHRQEWVGENRAPRLVFVASASVTVTFIDTDALGVWVGELGAQPLHELGAISWSLTDATRQRLETEARQRAIADAVARAADYAAAAGLGTPQIASIAEPAAAPPDAPQPMFAMARGGVADVGSAIELAAGEIDVTASVSVRFAA